MLAKTTAKIKIKVLLNEAELGPVKETLFQFKTIRYEQGYIRLITKFLCIISQYIVLAETRGRRNLLLLCRVDKITPNTHRLDTEAYVIL